MGQTTSVLKVTSRVTVSGDCGPVDAIRLSYGRRSCWGSKRRSVASFTFPREKWLQVSPQDTLRNSSAEVATVHVGKLREKDGNTPVRVKCLAGKVTVHKVEVSLAELLGRLKCTEGGGKAVLSFSLAGRRLHGSGAADLAFTALFCNGKRLADGGAQHLSGPPHQHQADPHREQHNGLVEKVTPTHGVENVMGDKDPSLDAECSNDEEKVMGKDDPSLDVQEHEEEKVMGEDDPSLDDEWETDEEDVMDEDGPSMDVEWVQEGPKEQKVRYRGQRSRRSAPTRTRDDNIPRGQGPVGGGLWDHVANCAGVVALGLIMYHAWVEADTYW